MKRLLIPLLVILSICAPLVPIAHAESPLRAPVDRARADGCPWWRPDCWVKALAGFVGDVGSAMLPEPTVHLDTKVQIGHKIENVDELRSLMGDTMEKLQGALSVAGGETRLTIETAMDKLRAYTEEVDRLAGQRIDQLDAVVQAKLLWIQAYTEQVSQDAQQIIRVASEEAQKIIRTTSAEIQANIGKAGNEARYTIKIAGEQARLTIYDAHGAANDVVRTTSHETQVVLAQANAHLEAAIEKTTEGIRSIVADTEGSSLRVLEGTLYVIERGADLMLSLVAVGVGLVFLFLAAYGWGRTILQHKLPEDHLARRVSLSLMGVTFCVAVLPFSFLSNDVRGYALLPANRAKQYAEVVGPFSSRLQAPPHFTRTEPERIIIAPGATPVRSLVLHGTQLQNGGAIEVQFGAQLLPVVGRTSDEIVVDLAPVYASPNAATTIQVRFLDSPSSSNASVPVLIEMPAATVEAAISPTAAPSMIPPTTTPIPTPLVSLLQITGTSYANVRSGPGNYPVIGEAQPGQTFVVTGRLNDWWQIRYSDQNGHEVEGWVWGARVNVTVQAPLPEIVTQSYLPFPTETPTPTATPTPTPTLTPTPTPRPITKIAFSSDRFGSSDIYVINSDGSGATNLTRHPDTDFYPSWSPDGRRITFTSNRSGKWDIYVMNADGSDQKQLTDNPAIDTFPSWSPDGRQIAFVSDRDNNSEIYIMNADGSGQPVRLTINDAKDEFPSWSPDSQRIVFACDRDGGGEICVINADGSGEIRLTNHPAETSFGISSWSPDGRHIAFETKAEIYIMNVDGSEQTQLTQNTVADGHPSWSPDGSRIVFYSERDGNRELYTMNADGSDQRRLTNQDGDDWFPNWSPVR